MIRPRKRWPSALTRPRSPSESVLGRYSKASGLEILRAHYGIAARADGSHWRRVLEELATDCFEYFKLEAKRRGRPRVWTDAEHVRLARLVRTERRRKACTIEHACEVLRSKHFPKVGVDKLIDHYQEGRRVLRNLAAARARRRYLQRITPPRRTALSGQDRK